MVNYASSKQNKKHNLQKLPILTKITQNDHWQNIDFPKNIHWIGLFLLHTELSKLSMFFLSNCSVQMFLSFMFDINGSRKSHF